MTSPKGKLLARLFALFCLPLAAFAADVGTLRGAIEEAVLRNPEVNARWHDFRAATHETRVAHGGWYPKLDLEVYGGFEDLSQDDPNRDPDPYTAYGASLTLRQLLFNGFGTINEEKRLDYASRVRYYELLAASEQVALEATRAYLDVLRYRRQVGLAQDNFAVHKEIHDHIATRVEAGIGKRVDLEQAAGRLALAESNLITETSNLHDVSARFERIVGQVPPARMAEPSSFKAAMPKVEELREGGFRYSPEMNAALENIRSARSEVDANKAKYWPTLELRLRAEREAHTEDLFDQKDLAQAHLVLNYNLLNGGSDRARIKHYYEKVNTALDVRDRVCRDLRQDTRIAWNDTQKLDEQLQFQDQHQLSTAKARDAYRKQFELGQRTLLDVLDSENELFDARRTYVNTETDRELAYARVMAPTGYLLKSLNMKPLEGEPDSVKDDPINDGDRVFCKFDPDAFKVARPAVTTRIPLPSRKRLETFTLKADALFDFDKWNLRPEGKRALDELYDGLAAHTKIKERSILVVGHTDRMGTDAYNQRLSDRRAQTVRDYLVGRGLPEAQVNWEGRGESEPVTGDTCKGEKPTPDVIACLQPDRRVVIAVDAQEEVIIKYDPDDKEWRRANGTQPRGAAPAPAPTESAAPTEEAAPTEGAAPTEEAAPSN